MNFRGRRLLLAAQVAVLLAMIGLVASAIAQQAGASATLAGCAGFIAQALTIATLLVVEDKRETR